MHSNDFIKTAAIWHGQYFNNTHFTMRPPSDGQMGIILKNNCTSPKKPKSGNFPMNKKIIKLIKGPDSAQTHSWRRRIASVSITAPPDPKQMARTGYPKSFKAARWPNSCNAAASIHARNQRIGKRSKKSAV